MHFKASKFYVEIISMPFDVPICINEICENGLMMCYNVLISFVVIYNVVTGEAPCKL